MPLQRADFDQAARYLQRANQIMERDAAAQTRGLRGILEQAIRTLYADDHYVGDAKHVGVLVAATVTALKAAASNASASESRVEILKAAAVLRDRSGPDSKFKSGQGTERRA
jgi:hypothetical protein